MIRSLEVCGFRVRSTSNKIAHMNTVWQICFIRVVSFRSCSRNGFHERKLKAGFVYSLVTSASALANRSCSMALSLSTAVSSSSSNLFRIAYASFAADSQSVWQVVRKENVQQQQQQQQQQQ